MSSPDFSRPQRMSAGAIFILFVKTFKRLIGPFLTAIVVNLLNLFDSESHMGIGMAFLLCFGGCGVVSLLIACVQYFTKKFYIKNGNLIFSHGIINRENTNIPLDRIHSLRTNQGIWYRILGMRGIVFDTLATREEEIELILDEYEWQRLLNVIKAEDVAPSSSETTPPPHPAINTVQAGAQESTIRFSTSKLIADALCQNHLRGMAILGGFLVAILDALGNLTEEATSSMAAYLDSHSEALIDSPWKIVALLAAVYIGMLVLWVGNVLLRYSDMSMSHNDKQLSFTYGLLSRSSCRFFRDKVVTLQIKRNFLERRFGLATIMLKQALFVSAMKEEDNLKLYGADRSTFFLKWWLGKDYEEEKDIITAHSGRGAFFHATARPVVLTVVATVVLIVLKLYVWLILPALFLVYILLQGVALMRHSSITLKPSYLVVHDGRFAEIENFVSYDNIEVVRIQRSPFTRYFHRVSLHLSTSGTSFSILSLKESEAQLIYELCLDKTESNLEKPILATPENDSLQVNYCPTN